MAPAVRLPAFATRLRAGTLVLLLLAGCGEPAVDAEPRSGLEALYARFFDEADSQFGRDLRASNLEADELARQRLINAANQLAGEAVSDPKPRYEIELPYLNLAADEDDWDTPLHFRLTLTAEELAGLGVPVEPD